MRNITHILFAITSIPTFAQGPPTIQWQVRVGGSGADEASTIVRTADDGYLVTGQTTSEDLGGYSGLIDIWVVKLTANGAVQWQRCLGGPSYDLGIMAEPAPDGGCYLSSKTGVQNPLASAPLGSYDLWQVKLDADGELVWELSLGSPETDEAGGTATFPDGDYLVTGGVAQDAYLARISDQGGLAWSQSYGVLGATERGRALALLPDDRIILAGQVSTPLPDLVPGYHGAGDGWLLQTNETGTVYWSRPLGGSGFDLLVDVAPAANGDLLCSGLSASSDGDLTGSHGGEDAWIALLEPVFGGTNWQRLFGGSGTDVAVAAVQEEDGGFVMAASTNSTDGDVTMNHGDRDAWLVKMNAAGEQVWSQTFGGAGNDDAADLIRAADGGLVLVGGSASDDGDLIGVPGHGGEDVWVVKFNPNVDAISEMPAPSLELAPVPASHSLSVNCACFGRVMMTIRDATGRHVRSMNMQGPQATIPLEGMARGSYTVVTNCAGSSSYGRFVVEP